MTCGIYMIKNKIDGKMYVGQAVDIERRWKQHCRGHNKYSYIDKAIKKHGKDNFELIVLRECKNDINLLNKLEQHYIKKYKTYEDKNHYNLTPGGDFSPSKVPEIAKKISEANKGKKNYMYGKKHTQKTRKKISEAIKGKKHPLYGKHLSQETKRKMSKKHKNKIVTQETKEKLSRINNTTGYFRVSKHKNKIYKQGFCYEYNYYDNGKRKKLSSVDFNKLEKKVKDKGLPWKKL